MKIILPFIVVSLFVLSACQKGDQPPVLGEVAQPKSVTINYYTSSGLLQTSTYLPIVSADETQFGFHLVDTSYLNSSQFWVCHSKVLLTKNVGSFFVNQVVMENKLSESVSRFTNGSYIKQPAGQRYSNLKATFSLVNFIQPGFFRYDVQVTQYSDSLQRQVANSDQFILERVNYLDSSHYYLHSGAKRQDLYWIRPDSVTLVDRNVQTAGFLNLRYTDYFRKEAPWYNYDEINRAVYHGKSAFAYEKFIFQNGYNTLVEVSPGYSYNLFVPQFERRVNYKYSSDSTGINEIIRLLNPGTIDPVWYYMDAYRRTYSPMPNYGEGNDIYSIPDWTSSSSTDSVFVVNNNVRQFKQAKSTSNSFEKDAKGRLVKITRRVSNSDVYKVMHIAY
jgi:hypothetical protein